MGIEKIVETKDVVVGQRVVGTYSDPEDVVERIVVRTRLGKSSELTKRQKKALKLKGMEMMQAREETLGEENPSDVDPIPRQGEIFRDIPLGDLNVWGRKA